MQQMLLQKYQVSSYSSQQAAEEYRRAVQDGAEAAAGAVSAAEEQPEVPELPGVPAEEPVVQELPEVPAARVLPELPAVLHLLCFRFHQASYHRSKSRWQEAVFHIMDKMPFHYLRFSFS